MAAYARRGMQFGPRRVHLKRTKRAPCTFAVIVTHNDTGEHSRARPMDVSNSLTKAEGPGRTQDTTLGATWPTGRVQPQPPGACGNGGYTWHTACGARVSGACQGRLCGSTQPHPPGRVETGATLGTRRVGRVSGASVWEHTAATTRACGNGGYTWHTACQGRVSGASVWEHTAAATWACGNGGYTWHTAWGARVSGACQRRVSTLMHHQEIKGEGKGEEEEGTEMDRVDGVQNVVALRVQQHHLRQGQKHT